MVGVEVSLARALQLIFIGLYFMASLIKPIFTLNDSFFRSSLSCLKNHYWVFLSVSLTTSSLVFLWHLLINNPVFKMVLWEHETALLHHAYVRPFFEIIIYLYYFWYFVILPHKIFKNIAHLKYFFKVFSFLFIINLFLGYVDFIGGCFFNIRAIIPRHLIETLMGPRVSCDVRFHGFAGEPRDAFVYLVLGLAVYLLTVVILKKKINFMYILSIFLAIILTRSASGLIGLSLFVLLLLITNSFYRCIKAQYLVVLVLFLCITIGLGVYTSKHVVAHFTNVRLLFENLQIGDFCENIYIREGLEGQLVNILPILHLLSNLKSFNLLPVIFGNGIGTNVVINNFVASKIGLESGYLYNSATQVVRLIYEFGMTGLFLFVLSMIRPIILLSNKIRDLNINTRLIVVSMLAVLASGLAQRNAAPFIFLGIAHVSLLILKVDNVPIYRVGKR